MAELGEVKVGEQENITESEQRSMRNTAPAQRDIFFLFLHFVCYY